MLCKGGCGKEVVFGSWCCKNYYECEGYKKKLSNKAKLRGNNGIRGRLSKTVLPEGLTRNDFIMIELICSKCNEKYETKLKVSTIYNSTFKPICKVCKNEKIRQGMLTTYNGEYNNLSYSRRKKVCWKEQNYKCNKCGYNQYSIDDGPYQLHHRDGNRNNKTRENEEVLCCNCHSMTKNFGFKNRKHSIKSKGEIGEKSKGRIIRKKE